MTESIETRLNALLAMPHVTIDRADADWLVEMFRQHGADLPPPYVYPSVWIDGGVLLEWGIRGLEITIDVDLKSRRGQWYVCEAVTGDTEEDDALDLNEEIEWAWLVHKLRRIIEKGVV